VKAVRSPPFHHPKRGQARWSDPQSARCHIRNREVPASRHLSLRPKRVEPVCASRSLARSRHSCCRLHGGLSTGARTLAERATRSRGGTPRQRGTRAAMARGAPRTRRAEAPRRAFDSSRSGQHGFNRGVPRVAHEHVARRGAGARLVRHDEQGDTDAECGQRDRCGEPHAGGHRPLFIPPRFLISSPGVDVLRFA
jgi:hypothetical protein